MLDNIRETMATSEFEDFGWIALVKSEWSDSDLCLGLELNPGIDDSSFQVWELHCRNVRSHCLSQEFVNDLEVFGEHVLLFPHIERKAELYVSSPAQNIYEVIGQRWEEHQATTKGWMPFDAFFNPLESLSALLGSGKGLLAEAPLTILRAYESVLTRYNIRHNRLNEHPPKMWNGEVWVPESEALNVLVVGQSFVVAESFQAIRQSR